MDHLKNQGTYEKVTIQHVPPKKTVPQKRQQQVSQELITALNVMTSGWTSVSDILGGTILTAGKQVARKLPMHSFKQELHDLEGVKKRRPTFQKTTNISVKLPFLLKGHTKNANKFLDIFSCHFVRHINFLRLNNSGDLSPGKLDLSIEISLTDPFVRVGNLNHRKIHGFKGRNGGEP